MTGRQDLVLGAGLSGLTAAYTLQQAGERHWWLVEKEGRPGGHARSVVRDGYTFDLGPHILFTNDANVERLVRDLLGDNLNAQAREAFIYHLEYGCYTRFPFQAHLHGLPAEVIEECLVGFVESVQRRAAGVWGPRNYEEWMRGFFGDGIADRLMIPYAKKLWTVPPSEMSFSWIHRRVPTPDAARIIAGALRDDVVQVGATAEFWYPWRGGIEALARALAERVEGVQCGREVSRIDPERRTVTFSDGDRIPFDRLVFTLPLSSLPHLMERMPRGVAEACRRLRYQGILNVNLGIARPRISDKHWIYFYEDAFPFHRLSFPANFSPHNVPPGKSAIATEIAFRPDRPPDVRTAVDRTVDALRTASILRPDDEIELVHVEQIVPAYVIYDLGHEEATQEIKEWLLSRGIWPCGRFGEWGYLNMDQAMKSGQAVAAAILGDGRGGAA